MKRSTTIFRIAIALVLGSISTLVLLWLLSNGLHRAQAQGPDTYSVYYVAPGGSCGAGFTPCYATVQAAVDAADDPGDVIKVAAGVYTDIHIRPRADVTTTGVVSQVVYITKTVTVRGGFAPTDWMTPDPESNLTTLDAQRQGRVIYITGDISPTIEGLRITGGNSAGLGGFWTGESDEGGGIFVVTATAKLTGNRVISNTCQEGSGGGVALMRSNSTLVGDFIAGNAAGNGGGLYIFESASTLSGNTINGNAATSHGGGLYLLYADPILEHNMILSNTASAWGGGLFAYSSGGTLRWNTISDNTAGSGGGLFSYYGSLSLDGNLITANSAGTGGGIGILESGPEIVNTVIADNVASTRGSGIWVQGRCTLTHATIARNRGGDGSGIYVDRYYSDYYNSSVSITNTILVSHTVGITTESDTLAYVNGVLWYGNAAGNTGGAGAVTVANEHTAIPAFLADGYHIASTSPAVDQGVDAGTPVDIDNEPRPTGAGYDLGADEYSPLNVYLPVTLRGYRKPD